MKTTREQNVPLVFLDDAHTFGGTQIALAWTIQMVLSRTDLPVLCLCTARTRSAIEAIVGQQARLRFEMTPSALPLNLFTFPLRLPPYWFLLRRISRQGVAGWWLNQPDIEFCLAPLLVLRALGQVPRTYLHGTGCFAFFYRDASWQRRMLSRFRDAVANRYLFRLHRLIVAPSRASQAGLEARISSQKRPRLDYLYPPSGAQTGLSRRPSPTHALGTTTLQLWIIGGVVQGIKNQRCALDVLEQLLQLNYAASLTVAGDGPDLESFRAQVVHRGLGEHVTCLGWVTDPFTHIPCDATVLVPSFFETMSLVAQEAMRCGLRMVTSPIAVFHEWVPASLISADFSPAAFADRVLAVNAMSADELTALYEKALAPFAGRAFLEKLLCLNGTQPHD